MGPPLTHVAVNIERWRANLVRKEIVLPDGSHIVYLEGGTGESLVLVHGFGANKDNFTRVARWLTPHYHVIIPDLVGFGESSHLPDVDYHFVAQANRVHEFVKAIGLTRVNLGGNSMGGAIVLSYASQYPDEVTTLWLLDTAGIANSPPSELVRKLIAGEPNPLMIMTESDFPALMKFTMSDPPYLPELMMNVMAQERMANQEIERRVFQQISTDSVNQAIQHLPTPALIVWGAEDRVLSFGAIPVLQSLLPHVEVIIMPGIGHAPMIEQPKQVADDYLQFRVLHANVVAQ